MFPSISFAPKTTQMGKQIICDLDIEMIDENCDDAFITPESTFLFNTNFFGKPFLDSNHFKESDLKCDIQENFYKKCSILEKQQQEHQYTITSNFDDLNLIEENFPNIPISITKKINEQMLKKNGFQNFNFLKDFVVNEAFNKRKMIIENEIQKDQSLNIFTMIAIQDIEEEVFDDFRSNSPKLEIKKKVPKIEFAFNKESPINLLPRAMPKLVFPKRKTKSPTESISIQVSDNHHQNNISQSSRLTSKIIHSSPSNLSPKCSQSSQTEDMKLIKHGISKLSSSLNRLFPKSSKSVTPVKSSTDTRKAFIIDERLMPLPDFQQVFADYRIIFRTLKSYDMEINEHTCIIFRPILVENLVHQTVKSFNISNNQIVEALTKFEKVFIIISLEDEFKQYNEMSEENMKLLSFICDNQISIKIREFPTNKSAFNFIHSLVDDSQKFLRDCESLHEHLLSLFPTISKSLAQAILTKGNPIVDCSAPIDKFPKHNILPFKQLLDTPSTSFKKRKVKNKSDKIPYSIESDSQLLYVSSNKKISAPFPSTILLSNEL